MTKKRTPEERKQHSFLRLTAGQYAIDHSTKAASSLFTLSSNVIKYHKRKLLQYPRFHPLQHGGLRHYKFSPVEHENLRTLLWILVQEDPTRKLSQFVEELNNSGYQCSKEFVRKIFVSWRWSWKIPSYQQLLKYTPRNVERYGDWVEFIVTADLSRVKFCDEAHFVSKDLSRRRAIGPRNTSTILIRNESFAETYSVSLLCCLDSEKPLYISSRVDSNTQIDFFKFVIDLIDNGYLKSGDILVCDNASVHGGLQTIEVLLAFIRSYGIELLYLPAYSPELNPCELVFAQVKRHLREYRDQRVSLLVDIAIAFALVAPDNINQYYRKCSSFE